MLLGSFGFLVLIGHLAQNFQVDASGSFSGIYLENNPPAVSPNDFQSARNRKSRDVGSMQFPVSNPIGQAPVAMPIPGWTNGVSAQACTNEGQQTQSGYGLYVCRNGVYEHVACVASNGARIQIGSNYTQPNFSFFMQCQLAPPSGPQIIPVACKNGNDAVQPGESFVRAHFWYMCIRNGSGVLAYEAKGCVNQETGERIRANSTFKTQHFTFYCYKALNGCVYAQPVGCVVNGVEYPINADVESASQSCWYQCVRTDHSIYLRVMGCMEGGRKYEVGDSIIIQDYVYRCIRNPDESVTREPIGCVEIGADGTPIQHKFGDRWIEGTSNPKHVYECRGDSRYLVKAAVQCVFERPEGQGRIDGGCMRRFGQVLLLCYQGPNNVYGQLHANAPPGYEEQLKTTGLKMC